MIKTTISIPSVDSGAENDTYTKYKFIYMSSDSLVAPETKAFESTSYPEEEGEHILTKTVDAAFDYKVRFLVQANGKTEYVNGLIQAFNKDLYTVDENGMKVFKQIVFNNTYKGVRIVGIPSPISAVTDFWHDSHGNVFDMCQIELKIRVTKPSLCNFNFHAE